MKASYTIKNESLRPKARAGTNREIVLNAVSELLPRFPYGVRVDDIGHYLSTHVDPYSNNPGPSKSYIIAMLTEWTVDGWLHKVGGRASSRRPGGKRVAAAQTPEKAAQTALVALQAALLARYRASHVAPSEEVDKAFSQVQKVMTLAIRPGTPSEGATATRIAFKKLIDLLYS